MKHRWSWNTGLAHHTEACSRPGCSALRYTSDGSGSVGRYSYRAGPGAPLVETAPPCAGGKFARPVVRREEHS